MRRNSIFLAIFWLTPAFAQPKLELVRTALHQFDGGPPMPRPAIYHPTELLFFSARIAGYRKTAKEAVSMEWEAQAFDDKGLPLAPPQKDKVDAELGEEDKEWQPIIRFHVDLPQTASCSNCRLKIQVKDAVASATASAEVSFGIQGRTVEPSDTLTARNFRFLRSEEDANPLTAPSYRPGDDVWGRFEITGFKYGEKNRIQVEYGLSVFRPSGKLLYQEPKAATADETSFYPRAYLPGVLSLKLDSKMPPGDYPIVVEIRDLLANQKFETRVIFRIE